MSFSVGADAYDRFMGKYSTPLAPLFADLAGVEPGQRVLDVGCGPGALTAELVRRLGPDHVSAVDPSASFVSAARERHPEVDVHRASAEDLPFDVGAFDAALAQLVVHFMADPVAGLREMARVTRDGGVVAACVWDHSGDRGPLSLFWQAAHDLDPEVEDESQLTGAREGDLRRIMQAAGLHRIEERVAVRRRREPDLRGLVGAVHVRRRPGGRLRGRPRRGRPRAAARTLPCAAAGAAVHDRGARLGGTRRRVANRVRGGS